MADDSSTRPNTEDPQGGLAEELARMLAPAIGRVRAIEAEKIADDTLLLVGIDARLNRLEELLDCALLRFRGPDNG